MELLVVCCLLAGALAAPHPGKSYAGKYEGHKIVQVTPVTEEQSKILEDMRNDAFLDLDFWKNPHSGDALDIHVTPQNRPVFCNLMAAQGMPCKETVSNLQTLIDLEHETNLQALNNQDPTTMVVGRYARTAEIHTWMDNLARSSHVMTVENIGTSTEGRALKMAKLSTGSGRPAIFVHSGLHAREWISHATIIWIMNEMATKYGQDATVTSMLDRYDWYLLPVANPDGYEYTHDNDRFWRKTRSRASALCMGVDANRNFDSNFGGTGSSSNACSDTYRGPRAFSEPETAAIAHFVTDHGNVVFYMDVHAFSQMWLVPYGFTHTRPSDATELDSIANAGAQAIYDVNGKTFRVGTPGQLLYLASGGAFDWAKEKAGIKYSYTLELRPASGGIYGFVVNPSEIPASGREIWAGLVAAINRM